jgi:hypothetical protein
VKITPSSARNLPTSSGVSSVTLCPSDVAMIGSLRQLRAIFPDPILAHAQRAHNRARQIVSLQMQMLPKLRGAFAHFTGKNLEC